MNTPAPQVSPAKVAAPVAQLLALDQIAPDPNQPRKAFDEASIAELASSIKAEGLIQPITVKPNGKGYLIVDGERRYRAAKAAGLKEVPVAIRADLKDQDVTAVQLVANIQREDLTLPEQCDAVARLVKALHGPDGKGGQARAAQRLGKSEAWVSKRASAGELPKRIKDLVTKRQIVDIEIAHGLAELQKVDAQLEDDEAERMIRDIKDPERTWNGPVTRERVREALEGGKQAIEDREEAKAREAAAKKPGSSAGKKGGEDGDLSPAEKASRARERKMALVKEDRRNLRNAAVDALYAGLQLKKKNSWEAPLTVEYGGDMPGSGSADFAKYPATAEAARLCVHGDGDITLLKRLASGLPRKVVVDVDRMSLSLDEAQKVSDALKGNGDLRLTFKHDINGGELRAMVAKLAPAQVKTLPPTREEREAAKKKPKPAAGAQAPAKKASPKKKR